MNSAVAPSSNGAKTINTSGVACVPGWFDYSDLYNRVVEEAPPNSWLVEVGVYHGLSLRFLAHAAKAEDKNLTVVGVDWGRGSPEVPRTEAIHPDRVAEQQPGGNLASSMLATLITAGVADDASIILAQSVKAAKFVPDGSCAMVFIDACHLYDDVVADIRAWLPKVMKGGVIAGHDYFGFPGVRNAVHDIFGAKDLMCRDAKSCWEVRL